MGNLKNENGLSLPHSAVMYNSFPHMRWSFSCVGCGKVLIIALMFEVSRMRSDEYLLQSW